MTRRSDPPDDESAVRRLQAGRCPAHGLPLCPVGVTGYGATVACCPLPGCEVVAVADGRGHWRWRMPRRVPWH